MDRFCSHQDQQDLGNCVYHMMTLMLLLLLLLCLLCVVFAVLWVEGSTPNFAWWLEVVLVGNKNYCFYFG